MNRFINIILGVLAIIYLNCCKTQSSSLNNYSEENYYKVMKIVKLKNNAFVIYAKHNDEIYITMTVPNALHIQRLLKKEVSSKLNWNHIGIS